jgi:cysteine synthase A
MSREIVDDAAGDLQAAGPCPSYRTTSRIGRTPLVEMRLRIGARWHSVWLKLEQLNPGGSIKDRTAYALVEDLERRKILQPGKKVIESTSGNLGIALANICRERGYDFTAVVDPKVSKFSAQKMIENGAKLVFASVADEAGGYLLSRLRRVEELLRDDPSYVWTNQYHSDANPRVHREQTGAEIFSQVGQDLAAIFIGVSTGGTLAGIAQYMGLAAPRCQVIAVDLHGSSALGGSRGPRIIPGLGSACRSHFITPSSYHRACYVSDAEAIAACHQLRESTQLGLGGSSGAVIVAAARYLKTAADLVCVVCVCPDGADRYEDTIYNMPWLRDHGIDIGDDSLSNFDEALMA